MRSLKGLVIDGLKRQPALYQFVRLGLYARLRSARRTSVFREVYRRNTWGDASSVSGPGSSLAATAALRDQLPQLLHTLGVTSLLDIPCGDLTWISQIDLAGIRYLGADIVEEIVAANRRRGLVAGDFRRLDLIRDPLPRADAILCRDCLVHLSLRDAVRGLDNLIASGARYLLCTTFPGAVANADTVTPYWRPLNLERAPFGLPAPWRLLRDFSEGRPEDEGKYLGVWRLDDMPGRPLG
jgi:hypothetical protein